jgi:hypothetical protein
MASDITLAVGDGTRRMTYAELAAARNISVPAARRLTLRHHWHKQLGNDGIVIVSVPLLALEKTRKTTKLFGATSRHSDKRHDATSDTVRDARTDIASDPGSDPTRNPAIRALEHAVEGLFGQFGDANQRADRAEERADRAEQGAATLRTELVDLRIAEQAANNLAEIATAQAGDLRNRLEASEQRADRLHGELVEARAAERKAIDLVRYATAEASDQRKRADDAVDAERIARDEAAGLRAELEARQQWGLRRRLRWALGRKQ